MINVKAPVWLILFMLSSMLGIIGSLTEVPVRAGAEAHKTPLHCYLREAAMGTGEKEAGAKIERGIKQRGKGYPYSFK